MELGEMKKQPCATWIAKCLIDAGYACPTYEAIDTWLWKEHGIMIVPTHDGGLPYFNAYIQYIGPDGTKETHPVTGCDGTRFGAYCDALNTVLDLLTEQPPCLNRWQRIARRLGWLKETDNERWYREKVLPLQCARKPLKPFEDLLGNSERD